MPPAEHEAICAAASRPQPSTLPTPCSRSFVGDGGMRHAKALAQLTAARKLLVQPLQHGLLEAPDDAGLVALQRKITQWLRARSPADGCAPEAMMPPSHSETAEQGVLQLPHVCPASDSRPALQRLRRGVGSAQPICRLALVDEVQRQRPQSVRQSRSGGMCSDNTLSR